MSQDDRWRHYQGFASPRPARDLFLGIRRALASPLLHSYAWLLRRTRSRKRFRFSGADYPYFYHRYGRTWLSERAVEIPVILDRIRSLGQGARTLEVGHVLSHYGSRADDVLDLYDDSPGILREDAATFRPAKPYDLIVSISTLEHIGWDELPKDPGKVERAIANLRRCLAPGGRLIATVPVGYNPELDRLLDEGILRPDHLGGLKRINRDNEWVEAGWKEVRDLKFAAPFPFANAICVLTFGPLPVG